MNLHEILEQEKQESTQLEYKSKRADAETLVKEIVAFANTQGGVLIYGAKQKNNGADIHYQNIQDPQKTEEKLWNLISTRVEPTFDFEFSPFTIDDTDLVAISVDRQQTLSSYEINDRATFPIRRGSTTDYMHGYEIKEYYSTIQKKSSQTPKGTDQGTKDRNESEESLLSVDIEEIPERPTIFIPRPEGHISGVCTFADLYYPSSPVHISTGKNGLQFDEVMHAIACLQDEIELSSRLGHFTINQSNAAWVGNGFANFIRSLKNRQQRYQESPADYDLDLYKTEQAVFVANISYPFSEAVLIIYLEPYRKHDKVRHFVISLITDGYPLDTRPLTRFSDRADIPLRSGKPIEIHEDHIDANRVPLLPLNDIKETLTLTGEEYIEPTGLLCENPLIGEEKVISELFEYQGRSTSPLSTYQYLLGHFRHYPPDDGDYTPEMTRFELNDFSSMMAEIPLTWHNIDIGLNW